jgi:hypothetical protein
MLSYEAHSFKMLTLLELIFTKLIFLTVIFITLIPFTIDTQLDIEVLSS